MNRGSQHYVDRTVIDLVRRGVQRDIIADTLNITTEYIDEVINALEEDTVITLHIKHNLSKKEIAKLLSEDIYWVDAVLASYTNE